MPIYKKHRALSEKTTSVQDPIEVVQRGVISFVRSANGGRFVIPTNITGNIVALNLTPLSRLTAKALSASSVLNGWYCDYTLHYATDGLKVFGSVASTVTPAEIGYRLRMSTDYKLYVAMASMAATTAASNSRLASNSLFRQLVDFGTNQQRYLIVEAGALAGSAASTIGKKLKLSYEVVGYEY